MMRYHWDREKARINVRKHGIDFADAVSVFEDESALTIEDERFEEGRWVTLGLDCIGRLLVVVYCWLDDDEIRIVSARQAAPRERLQYGKKYQ